MKIPLSKTASEMRKNVDVSNRRKHKKKTQKKTQKTGE